MSLTSPASPSAPVTRIDIADGLTEFPREVFEHAETLEILNLTNNRLSNLPDDLGRLKRLKILFCSNNQFTHLPSVLGSLPALTMIGFRANQIESVAPDAFPPYLRWLILTENRLQSLPTTLGRCGALQKLMLSGNQLTTLPEEMVACERLELLRLAANRFEEIPEWILRLPALTWLALAGNPCVAGGPARSEPVPEIPWGRLALGRKLGEGASGVITQATLTHSDDSHLEMAVKVFKNEVTSDGLPACELAATLAVGDHPNLSRILGSLTDHPDGSNGMVMELIPRTFTNLAGPPSFDTCTRDVYPEAAAFSFSQALSICQGIASAMRHLHSRGILHGDLYAHNILVEPGGRSLLSDFGAAAFYEPGAVVADSLERIEVRAFGILMEELWERTEKGMLPEVAGKDFLHIKEDCLQAKVSLRPTFSTINDRLRAIEIDQSQHD